MNKEISIILAFFLGIWLCHGETDFNSVSYHSFRLEKSRKALGEENKRMLGKFLEEFSHFAYPLAPIAEDRWISAQKLNMKIDKLFCAKFELADGEFKNLEEEMDINGWFNQTFLGGGFKIEYTFNWDVKHSAGAMYLGSGKIALTSEKAKLSQLYNEDGSFSSEIEVHWNYTDTEIELEGFGDFPYIHEWVKDLFHSNAQAQLNQLMSSNIDFTFTKYFLAPYFSIDSADETDISLDNFVISFGNVITQYREKLFIAMNSSFVQPDEDPISFNTTEIDTWPVDYNDYSLCLNYNFILHIFKIQAVKGEYELFKDFEIPAAEFATFFPELIDTLDDSLFVAQKCSFRGHDDFKQLAVEGFGQVKFEFPFDCKFYLKDSLLFKSEMKIIGKLEPTFSDQTYNELTAKIISFNLDSVDNFPPLSGMGSFSFPSFIANALEDHIQKEVNLFKFRFPNPEGNLKRVTQLKGPADICLFYDISP
jgi:hypothetical protein